MTNETDDEMAKKALVAYCFIHEPYTNNQNLTCDEQGCFICNVGVDDAAVFWWESYMEEEMQLPFDPNDTEEMLELIQEMNAQL